MKVLTAEFVTSAAAGGTLDGIPHDGLPHVAMAGRSNVGKSSLLNALCRRKIARTSAAPGKTRLANVYRVDLDGGPGRWSLYLVDLPGYGYARGGAGAAEELRAVAEAYFAGRLRPASGAAGPGASGGNSRRPALPARGGPRGPGGRESRPITAALLLVDSRHPGLESDARAAEWLAAAAVEYRVVATKVDKLSRTERARNLKTLEQTFGMPPLPVSAASGEGLDTLWKTIASLARAGRA